MKALIKEMNAEMSLETFLEEMDNADMELTAIDLSDDVVAEIMNKAA